MLVDQDSELRLDDAHTNVAAFGDLSAEVIDGTLADRWHIVVIRRRADIDSAFNVELLRSLGVRQVISATIASFDISGYAIRTAARESEEIFIDLSDAPALSATAISTSCGRLLTGLAPAIREAQFALLPKDMSEYVVSPTRSEMQSAVELGMCYAALDVMNPPTDAIEHEVQTRLVDTLLTALDLVSPMATCLCPTKTTR